MKPFRVVFLLTVLLAGSASALAQVFSNSPDAQTGQPRLGSFSGGSIDTINIYNGNVNVNIPLISLPGRELPVTLNAVYNSLKAEPTVFLGQQTVSYSGGWRVSDPIGGSLSFFTDPNPVSCEGNPLTETWSHQAGWTDGLGTKRIFVLLEPIVVTECDVASAPSIRNKVLSEDGGILTLYTGAVPTEDRIKFPNGTTIKFTANPQTVTANGNKIVRAPEGLLDTVGRTTTFVTTQLGGNRFKREYTTNDSNGTPRTYTLTFLDGTTVCGVTAPPNSVPVATPPRMESIVFPNGDTYAFDYGPTHGYLTKIILPSTAEIRYTYPSTICSVQHDDYITSRTVDDGVTQSVWLYGRTILAGIPRRVTITNPDQTIEEHTFNQNLNGLAETVWKENGVEKQKVTRPWTVPSGDIKTIRNGLEQKTTLLINGYGGVVYQEETDWYPAGGSGNVIRRIDNAWDFVPAGSNPVEPLLWRQKSSEVRGFNPENEMYQLQGKTEYLYDQYEFESGQVHTNAPLGGGYTGHTGRGNLTTIRTYKNNTDSIESHIRYDNLGNAVKSIDPLGRETTTDFTDNFIGETGHGSFAYPKSVTSAVGTVTAAYNYDTGLAMKVTDIRGQDTTMVYDAMNRLKTVTGPNQRVTENVYDDATRKVHTGVKVDAGKWRRSEVILDKLGRVAKAVRIDPAGDVYVDTEYDVNGRVKRVSQPYRSGETVVWTTTTYDALDRPVIIANPDGSQVTIAYGALGGVQTVTETDEALNPRRMSFNGIGQMVKVEEANPDLATPLVTQYSYYVSGALGKVLQAAQTRTFTLDWLGRMSSESHPESGTTNYTYYADGQLWTRTDGRGAAYTATYGYDTTGRLKTINYADATPDVTYDYDTNHIGDGNNYTGLLTRVITGGVTTSTFGYNNAGYPTSEQTQATVNGVSGSFTTGYGYDLDGRLTSIQYPSGRTVTRSYQSNGDTAADRLLSITEDKASATVLGSVSDNAAGQVTSRTLGGVTIEGRDFNPRNQLERITASSGGTSLMDLAYGYGAGNNGRIRSRTDARQPEHSVSYTFDEMNRLRGVTGSTWGVSWGLDGYGNRTTQTPSGLAANRVGPQTFGYPANNNRNSSYSYDLAGNITGDGHSYDYDAESRIRSIDGGAVEFAYDSAGRRIAKTIGLTTTFYIYGLTGLLSEFTTTNSGTLPPASTDRLEYRVGEQTGTAVLLLDNSGTVMENNRVFPFGEPWEQPAASTNDQAFTTYDRDEASQLDYAMARHYAFRQGRFMSPDPGHIGANPADPQSWNAYAYVGNDPINFVDPDGLCTMRTGVAVEDGGPPCPPPPTTTVNVTTPGPPPWRGGGFDFGWWPNFDEWTERLRNWKPETGPGNGGGTVEVTLNYRVADIPGGQILHNFGIGHQWISCNSMSVGMGPARGGGQVPGGSPDMPGTRTQLVDHSGQTPTSTITYKNVDKRTLDTYLKAGRSTGPWIPGINDCNTWAANAIRNSIPRDIFLMGNLDMGEMPQTLRNVLIDADGRIHLPGR